MDQVWLSCFFWESGFHPHKNDDSHCRNFPLPRLVEKSRLFYQSKVDIGWVVQLSPLPRLLVTTRMTWHDMTLRWQGICHVTGKGTNPRYRLLFLANYWHEEGMNWQRLGRAEFPYFITELFKAQYFFLGVIGEYFTCNCIGMKLYPTNTYTHGTM